jgi:hypothetical protein
MRARASGRGVLIVAEGADLGNLDRRAFRIVRDDFLERSVGGRDLPHAETRERDAGLAFPFDLLLLECRQRLRVALA